MSASSVAAKRAALLSSNAVIVKLLDIQGNVNRITRDNIRHFVRPYPVEKREKMQVSLLATWSMHRSLHR